MYKEFPERILSDLPEQVQVKISNQEDLDQNDCRVTKSYLEKTIIHPENACNSVGQAISLIKLYMTINAKIPQSTIEYMRMHVRDEEFLKDLEAYGNISPVVKVCMNTLPMRNGSSSLLSFCHINSDMGFRRWNLYAENYGKLIKSVKRWCDLEATHLRSNCDYVLYLDEYHIGDIKKGKLFLPNPSQDMYPFIIRFFEPPINLVMKFTIDDNNSCGIKSFSFECKVFGDPKHSSILVLPVNPEMKFNMVCKNIIDVSKKIIDITRFQESMSCDIEAELFFNEYPVGSVDIESGEPKLSDEGVEILRDYCGVAKQIEVKAEEKGKVPKMTLFQRLKFVVFG